VREVRIVDEVGREFSPSAITSMSVQRWRYRSRIVFAINNHGEYKRNISSGVFSIALQRPSRVVYPISTLPAVVTSWVRSYDQIACTAKWTLIPFDMHTPLVQTARTLRKPLRYGIPSLHSESRSFRVHRCRRLYTDRIAHPLW